MGHTRMCLLPPNLQRRGLVFERKLVTMEREEWVTLVYGSYEHVPISYGFGTFFVSCWLLLKMMMYQQIDYDLHHKAWYMGHTSMCQFHTG